MAIEQELRELREQKIKSAFNRTEVPQISTKDNLGDKSHKTLENDTTQDDLKNITEKYKKQR